jgi:hypothetical protein
VSALAAPQVIASGSVSSRREKTATGRTGPLGSHGGRCAISQFLDISAQGATSAGFEEGSSLPRASLGCRSRKALEGDSAIPPCNEPPASKDLRSPREDRNGPTMVYPISVCQFWGSQVMRNSCSKASTASHATPKQQLLSAHYPPVPSSRDHLLSPRTAPNGLSAARAQDHTESAQLRTRSCVCFPLKRAT